MQRDELAQVVVTFVKDICARHSIAVQQLDGDTDLFATSILDSLRFVELVTFIQADLGVDVPDKKLVTRYFQTANVIAQNFAESVA
jgi:acyl carrier protein